MSDLKPSFYNILFKTDDKYYVYNTLSTAVAELDENTYMYLGNGSLDNINPEYIEPLSEQHFLVDTDADEQAEYLYFYNRLRFGSTAELLSITLVPSYECNLACTYCLQGQSKNSKSMSIEDVQRVLGFAEKRIIESREENNVPITRINAKLYGGEPMLQKRSITVFCNGMAEIAEKYSCDIKFFMTSNFTLLDDDIFNLIQKYKIITQVSIDGDKNNHDIRRIWKNGSGTYDVIINNLRRIKKAHLEDLIVIRLNIDVDNLSSAQKTMEEIHTYSTDVYFGFLENFNGYNDSCRNTFVNQESVSKSEKIKSLNSLMKKYGFIVPEEFGKIAPCALNIENKFYVDCFMNVYTCELALNQPELKIGVINNDADFVPNANFYKIMNHSPALFPECMNCKLMPMCAGGCSAKAYIRDGIKDGNLNRSYCMCDEIGLLEYLKDYVKRLSD